MANPITVEEIEKRLGNILADMIILLKENAKVNKNIPKENVTEDTKEDVKENTKETNEDPIYFELLYSLQPIDWNAMLCSNLFMDFGEPEVGELARWSGKGLNEVKENPQVVLVYKQEGDFYKVNTIDGKKFWVRQSTLRKSKA